LTQTLEGSVGVSSKVITLDEVRNVWGSGVSNNQLAHVKIVVIVVESIFAGRGKRETGAPVNCNLGMEGYVEETGSVREAYFIGERFGRGNGGAVYTVGSFQKELGKVRGSRRHALLLASGGRGG
jgi:hypothetical protein